MGAQSESVSGIAEFEAAFARAKSSDRTYVIDIKVDPYAWTEGGHAWWEVGTQRSASGPKCWRPARAWNLGRGRQRRGRLR